MAEQVTREAEKDWAAQIEYWQERCFRLMDENAELINQLQAIEVMLRPGPGQATVEIAHVVVEGWLERSLCPAGFPYADGHDCPAAHDPVEDDLVGDGSELWDVTPVCDDSGERVVTFDPSTPRYDPGAFGPSFPPVQDPTFSTWRRE